jgi:hypothetical protein
VAQPPPPGQERLPGEPDRSGRWPGKADAGRAGLRVDQVRQDREPADPVRERMVQHEHQGEPAIDQTGDQHRRPQRRGPRQRGHDHRQGGVQQRRFVPRLTAGHRADVAADIEVGVVDPDRAAAAERRPDQPLTQPRDSRDTLGDQPACPREVESVGLIEQQDNAELLRHLPGVHRQERPIRRARPVNHRLPPPRDTAGHRQGLHRGGVYGHSGRQPGSGILTFTHAWARCPSR